MAVVATATDSALTARGWMVCTVHHRENELLCLWRQAVITAPLPDVVPACADLVVVGEPFRCLEEEGFHGDPKSPRRICAGVRDHIRNRR